MEGERERIRALLADVAAGNAEGRRGSLEAACFPDVRWRVACPVDEVRGVEGYCSAWLDPLASAIPGYMRRDEIVMGGVSSTGSGHWVATLGHVVGNFEEDLLGIPGHGKLVFLRCGEFYRIEGGRIAEAVILPDLPDLARQAGRPLLPHVLGMEMLFPSPATHDGVLPGRPENTQAALELVEAMLFDLRHFEPGTFASAGQTGSGGYWHRDMLWYGPAGIGSNFTYAGFQRDHRIPFLTAFPDRVGGNHFARFGDGDYVCSGGWPSMTMTHKGPYLGIEPTGRPLTLRVMDFWRCQDGQIRENWVLLDLLDLVRQMGRTVLPRP
jgi:predicted ester cyclase